MIEDKNTSTFKELAKIHINAVIISIILIGVSIFGLYGFVSHQIEHSKLHANYIINNETSKLQRIIDSNVFNLDILEVMIIREGGMLSDFDEIAELICENDPAVRCLQLAPKGVITEIYPEEGNEKGYGNLFMNPARRLEAIHARVTGEMTLAGPFELHQGGMGVVARRPVYIEDDSGGESFWGFCIVVLDIPELLKIANIKDLNEMGYYYQLWRYPPNSSEKIVFDGEEEINADAVTTEIEVPGGTWYLSLYPKANWISMQSLAGAVIVVLVMDILMLAVLYYMFSTERIKRKLRILVKTDQLTGLYNIRHFAEVVRKNVDNNETFAVYYIDMNKFKEVNDTYGHGAGDRLLISVAERLNKLMDEEAIAFRIGGDEFTVVKKSGESREDFEEFKRKIEASFTEPFDVNGIMLHNTASCGYAIYPYDATTLEDLLRIADDHMYDEKNSKRQI